MGFVEEFLGPVSDKFAELSLATQLAVGFFGFIFISIVLNVLNQILFKNPNEPPVVFHWLPLIGSTVTYGMDPPQFFRDMQAKVSPAHTLALLASCCWPPY